MSDKGISIIDYGRGNLASVAQAVSFCGFAHRFVSCGAEFDDPSHVILPGVGAFPDGMKSLHDRDLVKPLTSFMEQGGRLLGVCLGMQLLFERGYEFEETEGLGFIRGSVRRIPTDTTAGGRMRKLPHIGWSPLAKVGLEDGLQMQVQSAITEQSQFYFVHSFFAEDVPTENLVAVTSSDGVTIPAIVARNNVVGVQFHPEKSGAAGLDLLRWFLQSQ